MNEHEDAIGSHQAKDGTRCSYADLLRRKIEAGDDADNAAHQVDEQKAPRPGQSLQEDTQNEEVEHVQGDVQQVGVQEDGRDKAPVLPGQDQAVDFCSIGGEHVGEDVVVLDIDGVSQDVRDDAVQRMGSRSPCYVGGGDPPDGAGADGNDPGDPRDACQCGTMSIAIERGLIALPC